MGNIAKKPYEISLWEDILTFVIDRGDGVTTEYEEYIPDGTTGQVVAQYYKERKICNIGSDTMDTPVRAVKGKILANVNGSVTFTFDMFSHYYDEDDEEFYENPFIKLLVNERKIKVRHGAIGASDTVWYDLIIKNVQENSENKTFSYTAKSLFVNELSKSGFNIELDAELENNTGTITDLASYILEESDWKLKEGEGANDLLRELKEEPLYQVILDRSIQVTDMIEKTSTSIPAGAVVYVFYSNIVNQESYVQLLYATSYETDDDRVITNSPNYGIDGVTYDSNGKLDFARTQALITDYRGKRLVRKAITKYDSTVDKYVSVYDNNGTEIYGFTETEYVSPASVRSYVSNPTAYQSTDGWRVGGNTSGKMPVMSLVTVPDIRDVGFENINNNTQEFTSCLKIELTGANQLIYNSGIVDHRQYINGFVKGEPYVFRIKVGQAGTTGNNGAATLVQAGIGFDFYVANYTLSDGVYSITNDKIYFQGSVGAGQTNSTPDYIFDVAECKQSLPYSEMIEMTNTLGLFIAPQNTNAGTYYIEDFQFFQFVNTSTAEEDPLLPGAIAPGSTQTLYLYYIPNKDYKSVEDIQFIYRDYKPASYLPQFNTGKYEKVRSITASESNRFNLIQELCETFECWPKFEVEHNPETGEILLEESTYRQKKWVSFHEYIGKDNYAGFKYGVNLKNIKRTIDSDSIVTKMIVKDNSNEFATDGFCSIARAPESPNGENFILDFSYYIQQGMLGLAETTNDLYLDTNGYIGYYKKLKQINLLRDEYIKEQSGLLADISEYQATYQTYSISAMEGEEQLKDKIAYVKSLTGFTFQEMMEVKDNKSSMSEANIIKAKEWWNNEKLLQTMASIAHLKTTIANHTKLSEAAKTNRDDAQKRYDELNRILTSREESTTERRLLLEKEELNRKFYAKYSRFLQEGSWISEDYMDDNLYCLDAESTLHTSAQPKVTYDISVLEISQLEGYENYRFALGDKTYMEDTEFFGWTWVDGIKTPYHEEIVVIELTTMLDSPEQDQIKVQNYKTQFEDLFQRMAATTQSVEYSTGEYVRVAGIVSTDGTINITTLQNSIANNALTLQNSRDQSVTWDETGITTVSLRNPNEMVRIVSGGLFVSADGGVTWGTGVTGRGINANYITAGQINTESISILNGAFPSFRWDNTGISAYKFDLNYDTGAVNAFDYGKFVRLDQYGLYGLDGHPDFDSVAKDDQGDYGEDKIWKNAKFALTWKGFMLRSNDPEKQGSYISITSEDDFQVFSNNKERVKIGLLGEDSNQEKIYGLRLRDASGATSLEQSSDGKLWLRDALYIGEKYDVKIGLLTDKETKTVIDPNTEKEVTVRQVFNANDKFKVYEDGSMVATDGSFTGHIVATSGKIGNMTIEQFEQITGTYEVAIESNSGTVFKNSQGTKILTARIYHQGEEVTEGIKSYTWYKFQDPINKYTKEIEVSALELDPDSDSAVYSCVIELA